MFNMSKEQQEGSCDQSIAGRMADNETELVARYQVTQGFRGASISLYLEWEASRGVRRQTELSINWPFGFSVDDGAWATK